MKLPDPKPFSGWEPHKTREFMTLIKDFFAVNPSNFLDDPLRDLFKMRYFKSRLTPGSIAREWLEA